MATDISITPPISAQYLTDHECTRIRWSYVSAYPFTEPLATIDPPIDCAQPMWGASAGTEQFMLQLNNGTVKLMTSCMSIRLCSMSLAGATVHAVKTDEDGDVLLSAGVPVLPAATPPDQFVEGLRQYDLMPARQVSLSPAGGYVHQASGRLSAWGSRNVLWWDRFPLRDWCLCGDFFKVPGICILDGHGDVWCKGWVGTGQLGTQQDLFLLDRFLQVPLPAGIDPVSLECRGDIKCVVTANASVWCWGMAAASFFAASNQTFLLSGNYRPPVLLARDFAKIESSGVAGCGLRRQSGDVYCWGDSTAGQLGLGTQFHATDPAFVLASATGLSCNVDACYAVKNGQVYAWGYLTDAADTYTTRNVRVPTLVPDLASVMVQNVSAMSFGVCARTSADDVYCWGNNFRGQLGTGNLTSTRPALIFTDARRLASSAQYSMCAVQKLTEAIFCWGYNAYYVAGTGPQQATPTAITMPAWTRGKPVTDLQCLTVLCCAEIEGMLLFWGSGYSYITTHSPTWYSTPQLVQQNVQGMAVVGAAWQGGQLIVSKNDTVYIRSAVNLGGLMRGKEDDTSGSFVEMPGMPPLVGGVSTGGSAATAALVAGDAWTLASWTEYGMQGVTPVQWVPVQLSAISPALSVSFYGQAGIAVAADHRAYQWGFIRAGLLGDGNSNAHTEAVPIVTRNLTEPAATACSGLRASCAALVNGSVMCWGDQRYVGSGVMSQFPVYVAPQLLDLGPEPNISALTCNNYAVCATNTTHVWCWGEDSTGTVGANGKGTTAKWGAAWVPSPQLVFLPPDGDGYITQMVASLAAVYLVMSSGSVYWWGIRVHADAANDPVIWSKSPTLLAELGSLHISSMACAQQTCCALTADADLYCWGINTAVMFQDLPQDPTSRPASISTWDVRDALLHQISPPSADILQVHAPQATVLRACVGAATTYTCAINYEGLLSCRGQLPQQGLPKIQAVDTSFPSVAVHVNELLELQCSEVGPVIVQPGQLQALLPGEMPWRGNVSAEALLEFGVYSTSFGEPSSSESLLLVGYVVPGLSTDALLQWHVVNVSTATQVRSVQVALPYAGTTERLSTWAISEAGVCAAYVSGAIMCSGPLTAAEVQAWPAAGTATIAWFLYHQARGALLQLEYSDVLGWCALDARATLQCEHVPGFGAWSVLHDHAAGVAVHGPNVCVVTTALQVVCLGRTANAMLGPGNPASGPPVWAANSSLSLPGASARPLPPAWRSMEVYGHGCAGDVVYDVRGWTVFGCPLAGPLRLNLSGWQHPGTTFALYNDTGGHVVTGALQCGLGWCELAFMLPDTLASQNNTGYWLQAHADMNGTTVSTCAVRGAQCNTGPAVLRPWSALNVQVVAGDGRWDDDRSTLLDVSPLVTSQVLITLSHDIFLIVPSAQISGVRVWLQNGPEQIVCTNAAFAAGSGSQISCSLPPHAGDRLPLYVTLNTTQNAAYPVLQASEFVSYGVAVLHVRTLDGSPAPTAGNVTVLAYGRYPIEIVGSIAYFTLEYAPACGAASMVQCAGNVVNSSLALFTAPAGYGSMAVLHAEADGYPVNTTGVNLAYVHPRVRSATALYNRSTGEYLLDVRGTGFGTLACTPLPLFVDGREVQSVVRVSDEQALVYWSGALQPTSVLSSRQVAANSAAAGQVSQVSGLEIDPGCAQYTICGYQLTGFGAVTLALLQTGVSEYAVTMAGTLAGQALQVQARAGQAVWPSVRVLAVDVSEYGSVPAQIPVQAALARAVPESRTTCAVGVNAPVAMQSADVNGTVLPISAGSAGQVLQVSCARDGYTAISAQWIALQVQPILTVPVSSWHRVVQSLDAIWPVLAVGFPSPEGQQVTAPVAATSTIVSSALLLPLTSPPGKCSITAHVRSALVADPRLQLYDSAVTAKQDQPGVFAASQLRISALPGTALVATMDCSASALAPLAVNFTLSLPPCTLGQHVDNSLRCARCGNNSVGLVPSPTDEELHQCVPCVRVADGANMLGTEPGYGLTCAAGGASAAAQPGRWRATSSSLVTLACQPAEACDELRWGGQGCAPAYTGRACSRCAAGYGRQSDVCSACPPPGAVHAVLVLVACLLLAGAAAVSIIAASGHGAVSSASTPATTSSAPRPLWKAIPKLFLDHVQTLAIAAGLELRWPPAILGLFNTLTVAAAPASSGYIVPWECILRSTGNSGSVFLQVQVIWLVLPVVTLGIMACVLAGFAGWKHWRTPAHRFASWSAFRAWLLQSWTCAAAITVYMLHPNLTQRFAMLLACDEHYDARWVYQAQRPTGENIVSARWSGGAWHVTERSHWLREDQDVECDAAQVRYALLPIYVLLVVGIPAVCCAGLWLSVHGRPAVQAFLQPVMGFLVLDTRYEMAVWPAVVMARKMFIMFVVISLASSGIGVQLICGVLLLTMSLSLHQRMAPYKLPALNALETASLLVLTITMAAGQLYVAGSISDTLAYMITVTLLALNVGFVLLLVRRAGLSLAADRELRRQLWSAARRLIKVRGAVTKSAAASSGGAAASDGGGGGGSSFKTTSHAADISSSLSVLRNDESSSKGMTSNPLHGIEMSSRAGRMAKFQASSPGQTKPSSTEP